MARMFKCDRCGKKFAQYEFGKNYRIPISVYDGCIGDKRKHMAEHDLCPKCGESFYNWMSNKKENK